jgi:hypothetical protein
VAQRFTPRKPPLPVVTAEDVQILSIEGDEVGALVVGEPPVQGPLTLASAEDMTVDESGSDVQGPKVPKTAEHVADKHQPSPPPMIMFPTDPSVGKAP